MRALGRHGSDLPCRPATRSDYVREERGRPDRRRGYSELEAAVGEEGIEGFFVFFSLFLFFFLLAIYLGIQDNFPVTRFTSLLCIAVIYIVPRAKKV